MSDCDKIREAATEVLRATEHNRDAINGVAHEGPHDKAVHMDPCTNLPGVEHVYDFVGDCAQCGGAQYGSDDRLQIAIVRLKLALGYPLQEWEQFQHAYIVQHASLS